MSNVSAVANAKELTIDVDVPDTLIVHTDPAMLSEILTVLLRNAITYSQGRKTVRLVAYAEGARIRIDVEDKGCGIPVFEQNKVFTRFFRSSNAVSISPDGSGLGLFLAHSLAQLLGATLSFVSKENVGSTFSILLPEIMRNEEKNR